MLRRILLSSPLTLALLLGSCLKNQEEIVVAPDGSLTITVTATGDPKDLADGWSVPLGSPGWAPGGADTARWTALVGARTGGRDLADSIDAGAWSDPSGQARTNVELSASARFARATDIPRTWAGADDPYASAALERSTKLDVVEKGGAKVYRFERRFHAREPHVRAIWKRVETRLEPIGDALEHGEELSAGALRRVADTVSEALLESAAWYAREAVGALFLEGDASLSLAGRTLVLEAADAAVRARAAPELLLPVVTAVAEHERAKKEGQNPPPLADPVQPILDGVRGALRASLARALESQPISDSMRNGVLHRLEWLFAHEDHTSDLGDESFTIAVTMPGTIVSGNFDALDGRVARWEFKGEDLVGRDVLIVVDSVVK